MVEYVCCVSFMRLTWCVSSERRAFRWCFFCLAACVLAGIARTAVTHSQHTNTHRHRHVNFLFMAWSRQLNDTSETPEFNCYGRWRWNGTALHLQWWLRMRFDVWHQFGWMKLRKSSHVYCPQSFLVCSIHVLLCSWGQLTERWLEKWCASVLLAGDQQRIELNVMHDGKICLPPNSTDKWALK